jgi:hypothetical protein
MPLSEEQRHELLTEIRTTRAQLADIPERLNDIEDTNRHTRWFAYLLFAGLVAGGFMFLWERSEDNREVLELQQQYDLDACDRANLVRAGQRQQWIDARTLLTDLGAGRETRQLANGLVANAFKNFPELDCSPVKEGKAPVERPSPPPAP